MKIKVLDMLAYAKDYKIEKLEDEDVYRIAHLDSNLVAYIYGNRFIEYRISDVYDSGVDEEKINIEALDKLREFCQLLLSQDGVAEKPKVVREKQKVFR